MTNTDRIVQQLIKDEYFHKLIIDPDEECILFWTNWENEAIERKGSIARARQILLSFKFKSAPISKEQKNLLWDGITHQIEKTPFTPKNRQKTPVKNYLYAVAAVVILIVIATVTYNDRLTEHQKITEPEIAIFERVAPKGKISLFEFEDGTTVKLFSGSKIRYPQKFSGQSREVYLEGEGFFEVAENENKPFIVRTNSLITTALGTSFNVRTYENIGQCDVSLVTGKVKVERLEKIGEVIDEVILSPGEEAILENDRVVKQQFNIEEVVSWKEGYIYLENKSFDETIHILERWFDVSFVVKNRNKADGKRGTGKFRGQNLENILLVIGDSFGFSFEIEDDKIFINL